MSAVALANECCVNACDVRQAIEHVDMLGRYAVNDSVAVKQHVANAKITLKPLGLRVDMHATNTLHHITDGSGVQSFDADPAAAAATVVEVILA